MSDDEVDNVDLGQEIVTNDDGGPNIIRNEASLDIDADKDIDVPSRGGHSMLKAVRTRGNKNRKS